MTIFPLSTSRAPNLPLPTILRVGKVSLGKSTKSSTGSWGRTKSLPGCIKGEYSTPLLGMSSKKPVHVPGCTASSPSKRSIHKTLTHIQRA